MNKFKWFKVVLSLVCAVAIVSACSETDSESQIGTSPIDQRKNWRLPEIMRNGVVRVITRNAPTTMYVGSEGYQGFEYDLVTAFADAMGIKVEFIQKDNVAAIYEALEAGEGDMAAAGLTKSVEREKDFLFGPTYQTVRQELVCHRLGEVPATLDGLADVEIRVVADSSYEETFNSIRKDYPEFVWTVEDDLSTEQLLEQVADQKIDCTVADSNIIQINRRYHPSLVVAMPLTNDQHLAWVFPKNATLLSGAVKEWLREFTETEQLALLHDRYYGHVTIFDYVNIRSFHRRIEKRLPKYRGLFQKASDETTIPWTLLAAQSYQESHWNPRAKSPTGVRGLMMLTQTTAKQMGYDNRINPENSVMGGARYMAKLIEQVPESVQGPDRLWFALAAYNVGMGHVHDAQILARLFGKDPNKWRDIRSVLPLLSQKRYYQSLKYGYARGTEPVRYVQRIRDFEDILLRHLAMQDEAVNAAGLNAKEGM